MNPLFFLTVVIGAALAPCCSKAADSAPAPAPPYVTVYGEVQGQGRYDLKPKMNVEDALKMAGGAKGSADLSKVRLVRKGATSEKETTIIDVKSAGGSPELTPGDIIVVDEQD
jgi:protein involved in polysaccharide export with SLBB domain